MSGRAAFYISASVMGGVFLVFLWFTWPTQERKQNHHDNSRYWFTHDCAKHRPLDDCTRDAERLYP